jgi:hypothetical protein
VEFDCLTPIKAIEASWVGIIEEIRGVSTLLPGCKVQHARQEAIKAAHSLAQRKLRTHECVVMRLNAPEGIRSLVEVEAAGTVL